MNRNSNATRNHVMADRTESRPGRGIVTRAVWVLALIGFAIILMGCHPDHDDPRGSTVSVTAHVSGLGDETLEILFARANGEPEARRVGDGVTTLRFREVVATNSLGVRGVTSECRVRWNVANQDVATTPPNWFVSFEPSGWIHQVYVDCDDVVNPTYMERTEVTDLDEALAEPIVEEATFAPTPISDPVDEPVVGFEPNVSGAWGLIITWDSVDSASCPPELVWRPNIYVEQSPPNSQNLIVTGLGDDRTVEWVGTIVDRVISFTGPRTDGVGTTTATFTLTLAADSDRFAEGDEQWTWVSDSGGYVCNGVKTVVAEWNPAGGPHRDDGTAAHQVLAPLELDNAATTGTARFEGAMGF